jgi:5-methylcytosine-specific restriction endonuclease McrA
MTCANYTAVTPTCACGNQLKQAGHGRPRKYCGPKCKGRPQPAPRATKQRAPQNYSAVGERAFECAQCSASFAADHKRMYCTASCKWRAQTLKRYPGARMMSDVPAKDRACKCAGCGNEYKNKRNGGTTGEGSKYCSRECAFADNAQGKHGNVNPDKPGASSRIYAGYCLCCGIPFVSRRARSFCSYECHPSREYVSIAPAARECATCGASFVAPKAKTRPTDFCSARCKASAISKQRRIQRSRRRALTRMMSVESVDPFKVFDRDKWRCQLCGTKTPRLKRGTFDHDAPELDHIITLADGGEHSYRNTQCACRKCNGAKSSRSMGQLLMFG